MAFTVIARRRNCRGGGSAVRGAEVIRQDQKYKAGGREVVALDMEPKQSNRAP